MGHIKANKRGDLLSEVKEGAKLSTWRRWTRLRPRLRRTCTWARASGPSCWTRSSPRLASDALPGACLLGPTHPTNRTLVTREDRIMDVVCSDGIMEGGTPPPLFLRARHERNT